MNTPIGSWDWIAEIQTLCRQAGQLQVAHFRKNPAGWGEEKVEKEYVSWVDVESERILQAGLYQLCPEAGFYGEETGQSGNLDLQWVVDPLDGTTNYLSGLDQFAVSVALVQAQQPVLAVVYKPVTQEFFTAVRGQGAQHNALKLPRHAPFPLSRAVVGTGFPYRSPDLVEPFLRYTQEVLTVVRDIRRLGCAAVDLCYVAVGYLQGFWESDMQPYDIAAALLVLAETGCRYSSPRKAVYDMFHDRVLVVGRPGAYEELAAIVARHYQD